MPTKLSRGKLANPPWINLRAKLQERPTSIDVNLASVEALKEGLGLSAGAANALIKTRKQRPIRDLNDFVAITGLKTREAAKLTGRVVGQIRPQVVLLSATIKDERIFSHRP